MPETLIPNAKPLIVEDAIQRETWLPMAHLRHPDDPHFSYCGVRLVSFSASGKFRPCSLCHVLRVADDPAPLRGGDLRLGE